MKKILLLATLSLLLVQCNKNNNLPELAKDNDYNFFNLKDRPCKINQKITFLEKKDYGITDNNINLTFNTSGYLINDSIFNENNSLIEVNNYEKLQFPTIKKLYISKDDFIINETVYDSLKNIIEVNKKTSKNQIIEQQKNTLYNNQIIQEDYFTSGNNTPNKSVIIKRKGNEILYKLVLSQTKKILDSIVYEYNQGKITNETHYNQNKKVVNKLQFTYTNENITSIIYFDALGKEEAIEKFEYNSNKQTIYKYVYNYYDDSKYEEINKYNKLSKIEKTETKLNGTILTSANYNYNTQGDLIQLVNNNYTNKENYTKKINYTYDKKGNWISKNVFINNKPIYNVNRKIDYCN